MTSSRPYLLRALYEWIVDNDMTPHVLVDAEYPDTNVPSHLVENGRIILNISPFAVHGMVVENELLSFSARFAGVPSHLHIPVSAVLAIYARENGRGMVFAEEEDGEPPPANEPEPTKKPTLRVVK